MNPPFIFLYGPPASGKSAAGARLAMNLKLPFYDLDREVEEAAGMVIPDIFEAEGEHGFRKRESENLANILRNKPGVVALGGGALLSLENRTMIKDAGELVCLTANFDTILMRLGSFGGDRPLLEGDSKNKLKELLEQRNTHYASFPTNIETDDLPVEEVVGQLQVVLGKFHIRGMGEGYDVIVHPGSVKRISQLLAERLMGNSIALVSDQNVAPLHAEAVLAGIREAGYDAKLIVIPAGENQKTFATVQHLLDELVKVPLDRGSIVIALGGGVIGDLAGFSAAIFLRGIRWVEIPTSLLAMVDASLGGKTGVDLPQGKNLAGAFHPPSMVLIDPDYLSTLPDVEMRNGLAEVIKHGVIDDPELFKMCANGWHAIEQRLEEIVKRAVAVKVKVIEEDPYEKGRRASLNLGHTLGHGLELASNFQVRHGEAVAIGMVAAARLAEKKGIARNGLADEICDCLSAVGLPVRIPAGIQQQAVFDAMSVDKKRRSGKLRVVLPVRVGEVHWGIEIDNPMELIDVMT